MIAHPDAALTLEPLSQIGNALTPKYPSTADTTGASGSLLTLAARPNACLQHRVRRYDWELGVALDEYEATSGLRAILSSSLITLLVIIAVTTLLLSLWLKTHLFWP